MEVVPLFEMPGVGASTGGAREGGRWVSPLRYPGGKVRMAPALGDLFADQTSPILDIEVWVEPFAGGAGAGLWLLDRGLIESFWMCERNHALATLWTTITTRGDALAARVEHLTPSMDDWHWAHEAVQASEDGQDPDPLDLALAAFLLNRLSRSGIVHPRVGPIGGKNQAGRWKIGDRFNGPALAERIRRVAALGDGITVHETDAIGYIEELPGSGVEHEVFLFVDPPYIVEGNGLYTHGMSMDDHARLAAALRACPAPWLLTYDDHPAVLDLYPRERVLEYAIPHTANTRGIGREWAVLSPYLAAPDDLSLLPRGDVSWVREGVWKPAPWPAGLSG